MTTSNGVTTETNGRSPKSKEESWDEYPQIAGNEFTEPFPATTTDELGPTETCRDLDPDSFWKLGADLTCASLS
jgi:hypothetical protein